MGVPVVASNVGGLLETVLDNRTGIHFNSEDHINLYLALKKMLLSSKLRDEFSVRGVEFVKSHYDFNRCYDKKLEQYKRLKK